MLRGIFEFTRELQPTKLRHEIRNQSYKLVDFKPDLLFKIRVLLSLSIDRDPCAFFPNSYLEES